MVHQMKTILIITDEKKSSLNQCKALVNDLIKGKSFKVKYNIIKKKIIHYLPNVYIYFFLFLKYFFKNPKNENFDVIVSCGRIAAPYNLFMKNTYKSCKNIHILDPYFQRNNFDLILLPSHDCSKFPNSKNIIETTGTLVNKKNCNSLEVKQFNKLFIGKKIVSCFIGGDGKSAKFSKKDIINLVKKINQITEDFHIVYCLSRRTNKLVKNIILLNKKKKHFYFDYIDPNPYWYLIKKSEYFIVTEDSISMISDSISTGKPVYIAQVSSLKNKIRVFGTILKEKGIVRLFEGKLVSWRYKAFNESLRVSRIIDSLF